jgi:DNA-binding MarR family transcriptional regulator
MDEPILRRLDVALDEIQRRLRVRMRRELQRSGSDLRGGYAILGQLRRSGPRSPSELADGLEIRTSTMTTHLDRLEASGYVRRLPRDGRPARVEVRLTPEGEAAYVRYLELRQSTLAALLAGLSDADRRTLADLLERAAATNGEAAP